MKLGAYLIWTATAIGIGCIVLLGYFLDSQLILSLRLALMRWAVLIAAAALLLGLWNLLSVHWIKVSEQYPGWPYSAVLILAFLVTLFLGLMFGPDNAVMVAIFNYIQLPIETSLMALLAISLVIAGYRIVEARKDLSSLIFIGTVFVILLGTGPWVVGSGSGLQIMFGEIRNWLAQVWAAGGARGILLGVALGSIVTGLRVLLAADRPYGE